MKVAKYFKKYLGKNKLYLQFPQIKSRQITRWCG